MKSEILYDDRICTFPCAKRAGETCHVPLRPHVAKGWTWDGNREEPTLTPSIRCREEGCGAHGFVRKGEWVKA